MNIIDISWPITADTTAYKDRKTISLVPTKTFEKDAVRESLITLSSHSGTHIDAPAHFLEHGATSEKISLNSLIGPCRVLDLTQVAECITTYDLKKHNIQKDERILLKTKNSELPANAPFNANFVYLDQSAAAYLAECHIALVGIDYLGIERNQPGHPTHKKLLENTITIVEGLRLNMVKSGAYQLYCLPLALIGLDGAPARALLIPQ